MAHFLSEDEYLVRLSRADRIKLAGRFMRHCHRPLLAAVLAAVAIWGSLVPALWGLLGLHLKALAGYGPTMTIMGSVSALVVRLSLFFLGAGALASFLLLSLNNLLDHCLEGEAPGGWAAVLLLLAPWSRWRGLLAPLGAWLGLVAAWGAALALVSLLPYMGLIMVLAGTAVFALLHNCAMWHLIHLEHEEPGLWAAVALPFRVLGHSYVLWRKTLALGFLVCLPGLAVMAAALLPLWTGFFLSGLVFLLGAGLLVPGLTFFGCYFVLAYKQALANYRLHVHDQQPVLADPSDS